MRKNKKEGDKVVVLRENGKFYNVFDDDCFVIYNFFGYKIVNKKVGFPSVVFDKVINTLEDNKINYKVISKEEKSKNFGKLNNYDKFLNQGKEQYEEYLRLKELDDMIFDLSDEEVVKVYEYMKELVNAR